MFSKPNSYSAGKKDSLTLCLVATGDAEENKTHAGGPSDNNLQPQHQNHLKVSEVVAGLLQKSL